MHRAIHVLAISGLIASVAVGALNATVRRGSSGSLGAVTSGSIRYTPSRTPAATPRTATSKTPRSTTSGSIHYAPSRSTPTTVVRPNIVAGGSIHYSKPSAAATVRPHVTVSPSINVHRVPPGGNRPAAIIGRPGTAHGPTPVLTTARPTIHHSTGESSIWRRPPVRPGYRPMIAAPIRGFDRSHWHTILRPWSVAPIGGGYGAIAGHGRPYGYHRYIYRPDGGRICYYRPPAWGAVYPSLPPGAITFVYGRHPYYCWAGVYYTPWDSGYRVVQPPLGAVVSYLPSDYSYMDVDGTRYFCSSNVYYAYVPPGADDIAVGRAGGDDEGSEGYYIVVDPPIGAEVTELPADREVVMVNGQTWYRVGDAWYVPVYEEDALRYMRVPRPE